jgi:hypothetical protein
VNVSLYDYIFFFACCNGAGVLIASIFQFLPFVSSDSIETGEKEEE